MIQITKKLTGRKYWRSLDQFYQTPDFRTQLNKEFPGSASEMLDEPSTAQCPEAHGGLFRPCRPYRLPPSGREHSPERKGRAGYIHGKPLYYNTVMSLGGAAQGLMIETNDGRPTKVEGNPDHPWSLGRARGYHQASVLQLYDPDRALAFKTDGKIKLGRVQQLGERDSGTARQRSRASFPQRARELAFASGCEKACFDAFPGGEMGKINPVLSNETALPAIPRIFSIRRLLWSRWTATAWDWAGSRSCHERICSRPHDR